MKKSLLILALLGIILGAFAQNNQQFDPTTRQTQGLAEIDETINAWINYVHKPGFSACIIKDDSIVWRGNYGWADVGQEKPVTKNTLFYAFSIGKCVTAASIMNLWENGLLDLDENVNNFLPFQIDNPHIGNDSITARMLMTHSSSIIDYSMNDYITVGDSPLHLETFLQNYLSEGGTYYAPQNFNYSTPGSGYEYSNFGSALNGYLAEVLLDREFKDYAQDSILDPLNMERSTWFLSDVDFDDFAYGYDYNGTNYVPNPLYGFPAYPGVTLKSCTEDLAQFVIMLMNSGVYKDTRILNQITCDTMCVPYLYSSNSGVGMGVYEFELHCKNEDKIIYGHKGGGSLGYAGEIQFCPEDNIGVVYLSNSEMYAPPLLRDLFEYGALIVLPKEATDNYYTSFVANWQEAPDAIEYYLDISTDWQFVNMVEGYDSLNVGLVTSFEVTGLAESTEYWYRIRAHNGFDFGPVSSGIHTSTWITGIGSSNKSLPFTISPNPIKDIAILEFEFRSENRVNIELFDLNGQRTFLFYDDIKQPGSQKQILDISSQPPGIYFLRLQAGNEVVTKKVVKL